MTKLTYGQKCAIEGLVRAVKYRQINYPGSSPKEAFEKEWIRQKSFQYKTEWDMVFFRTSAEEACGLRDAPPIDLDDIVKHLEKEEKTYQNQKKKETAKIREERQKAKLAKQRRKEQEEAIKNLKIDRKISTKKYKTAEPRKERRIHKKQAKGRATVRAPSEMEIEREYEAEIAAEGIGAKIAAMIANIIGMITGRR